MKNLLCLLFVLPFLFSCDNRADAPKCEEINGLKGFKRKDGYYILPTDLNDKYHIYDNYPQYGDKKFWKYTGIIKLCENNKVIMFGTYLDGKLHGRYYDYENKYNAYISDEYLDFNLFALFRKPKLTRISYYENGYIIPGKGKYFSQSIIHDILGIIITPLSLFLIFILYRRRRKLKNKI